MGDLFDGYAAPAAHSRPAPPRPAWDEMFEVPPDGDRSGVARDGYREIHSSLARMTQSELRGRTEALASSYLAQGVTFDFAGEERPFPLDAVPRVIDREEWTRIDSGVKQRVR